MSKKGWAIINSLQSPAKNRKPCGCLENGVACKHDIEAERQAKLLQDYDGDKQLSAEVHAMSSPPVGPRLGELFDSAFSKLTLKK